MKKHLFCGTHSSINIRKKNKLHPAPIQKYSGLYKYIIPKIDVESCTTVLSVFLGLVPTPPKLSLCRALIFALSWYTPDQDRGGISI